MFRGREMLVRFREDGVVWVIGSSGKSEYKGRLALVRRGVWALVGGRLLGCIEFDKDVFEY